MISVSGTTRRLARQLLLPALIAVLATSPGCTTIKERLHLNKGTKLYKAQKYEEAIGEFDKILQFHPQSWYANYMVSISYLALYHPGSMHPKDQEYADKAVASFRNLLKLEAPTIEARDKVRAFYVNLLIGAGKLDDAIAFFEELLQKEPQNLDYMSQAAQLYAKNGNPTKALEYYQRRADADPKNKEAWYTIGVVCWERSYKGATLISNAERSEVIERGFAAMNKALELDPEYVPALSYTNLLYREQAKTLFEVGDTTGAGTALLKADEYQKKALAVMHKNKAAAASPATPEKPGA